MYCLFGYFFWFYYYYFATATTMAKFNPPAEFDFVPERWEEWSRRWEMFRTISKLNKEDAAVQIDSLL